MTRVQRRCGLGAAEVAAAVEAEHEGALGERASDGGAAEAGAAHEVAASAHLGDRDSPKH